MEWGVDGRELDIEVLPDAAAAYLKSHGDDRDDGALDPTDGETIRGLVRGAVRG